MLEGHIHCISASAVTKDKTLIVTADDGGSGGTAGGSVLIVWDARSGRAVRVIDRQTGCRCLDLSDDGMFIAVVSNTQPQQLAIYEWSAAPPSPSSSSSSRSPFTAAVAETQLPMSDVQCVRFSSSSMQELVLNSASAVAFCSWSPSAASSSSSLSLCLPSREQRKHSAAAYTQSCFIPFTSKAVTATQSGHLILWEQTASSPPQRQAVKTLKLVKSAITVLTAVADRYLACGCGDGVVRFFDFQFRLAGWCDELRAGMGGVVGLSFDHLPARPAPAAAAAGNDFAVPSFVLCTSRGKIIAMQATAAESRGAVLLSAFESPLTALHCHPSLPLFATATAASTLSVWDLEERRLIGSRTFSSSPSSSSALSLLRFSPYGNLVAVGFGSGELRIVDTSAIASTSAASSSFLADVATFKPAAGGGGGGGRVSHLSWSSCGSWLASGDDGCNVSLYRWWHADDDVKKEKAWLYVGRYRSHYGAIVALQFAPSAASSSSSAASPSHRMHPHLLPPLVPPSLLSLGQDRTLHQYDLSSSSIRNGLRLLSSHRVEESALPTALLRITGRELNGGVTSSLRTVERDDSELLVIANDEYKLRVWELGKDGSLTLRRTLLAPTFSGGITALSLLPSVPGDGGGSSGSSSHLLFSSTVRGEGGSSYLGLLSLPLRGHPASAVSVLSHPAASSSVFSCAFDGSCALSFSPADTAVKMWRLTPQRRDREGGEEEGSEGEVGGLVSAAGGGAAGRRREQRHEPSGGADDVLRGAASGRGQQAGARRQRPHRHQRPRPPLPRPRLLPHRDRRPRAPHECSYLQRLAGRAAEQQQEEATVTRAEFVRLYVNHRPVFGVGREQFEWAMRTVKTRGQQDDQQQEEAEEQSAAETEVDTRELLRVLMEEGDCMTAAEILHCLDSLIGDDSSAAGKGRLLEEEKEADERSTAVGAGSEEGGELRRLLSRLPPRMTAEAFATTILGFGDY